MSRQLVFATNNTHKLEEVSAMLGDGYEVLSLKDIGCEVDIPETADTFAGNAMQKAEYVKQHYGYDCFADDSGLEVAALNGEPGVYSARYSGVAHDSEANMDKLLNNLKGKADRKAQFRTVVALLEGDQFHTFEGIVKGHIIDERRGSGGFGYDPIFVPEGYSLTFAEMGSDEKNKISHRARAIAGLIEYLKQ